MIVYSRPTQCTMCGSTLRPYLSAQQDSVYGVVGTWDLVRCSAKNCGVIFLAHDLDSEQIAGFYGTYSTHSPPFLKATGVKKLYRDALKHIWFRRLGYPTQQRGLARIAGIMLDRVPFFRSVAMGRLFWLPYRPAGEVIEVGFGNAQALQQLRAAGWTVRGSEFDEHCVEQARRAGLDVRHGDFASGLYEAGSADAVVASHAIEHVPDPLAFLTEAFRVLRPGGMTVLVTPNGDSSGARWMGAHWRGLEVPRHLTIHNPASLRTMAKSAGFSSVEVFGTPTAGFIWQQSHELSQGCRPSASQSLKTLPYNVLSAAIALRDDQKSDEIVLRCTK